MGTDHKKTYQGGGGGGEVQKKNSRKGKLHEKKIMHAILILKNIKLASHEEELEFRSSPRNKRLRGRLPSNSLKIYSSTVKNADCD